MIEQDDPGFLRRGREQYRLHYGEQRHAQGHDRRTTGSRLRSTSRAQYDTAIMSVFGREQIALGDQCAGGVVTLRSYINISILVDTSQSMGIGANDLDQQRVAQATGCAFACTHQSGARAFEL